MMLKLAAGLLAAALRSQGASAYRSDPAVGDLIDAVLERPAPSNSSGHGLRGEVLELRALLAKVKALGEPPVLARERYGSQQQSEEVAVAPLCGDCYGAQVRKLSLRHHPTLTNDHPQQRPQH